jgi:hypothetical protein
LLGGLVGGLNYYLVFRPPVGLGFTSPNVGGDEGLDSDADALGATALFVLSPGEVRTDLDAGLNGAAPEFGFAVGVANPSVYDPAAGKATAVDEAGNVYVGGNTPFSADFDPGPGIVEAAGGFLAKYTAAGALCWARCVGGNVTGIALASDGSICVTGGFAETVDFDPSTNDYLLTSVGSSTDIFVLKLDVTGHLLWVRQMGGTETDFARGIVLDDHDNIYTTGNFAGTVDFNPGSGTANLTSKNTSADVFVSKLDSAGNYVWVRQLGGSGADIANGIALGPDGSIYTTGYFSGTADFDPGSAARNLTSNGTSDIFISKLNSSGNYVWACQFGGNLDDVGNGIAVASDGSVYSTGKFRGTADFDPGPGTTNLVCEGSGNEDIFILKLDAAGNFGWARGFGGLDFDSGSAITLGPDGGVYATGSFRGTADFDPGPGSFTLTNSGSYEDAYVLKLDDAGNLGWVGALTGALASGYSIAVGQNGNVFTTGSFGGTVDFDPGPNTLDLSGTSGDDDVFISMLRPNHAPSAIDLSTASVPEHSRGGTIIGQFSASDPDTSEAFTYELADTAEGRFKLTGSYLQVDDGSLLDYSQNASHNVTVRVRDSLGAAYEQVVAITVTQEPTCSMGDRVWNDLDGNGVQDNGERGLPGVVVEVFQSFDSEVGDADDVSLGQTATNSNGEYVLGNLAGGRDYYLVFRAPVGCTFTTADAGTDDAVDSDANSKGVTAMFTPAAGDVGADLDAGLLGAIPSFGYALRAGGTSSDTATSVTVDAEGNVYVAGYFSGTVDFDSGPGIYNLTSTNSTYTDVFVAKYSQTGSLYWARNFGGRTDMCRFGVAVASDGSVYVNGTFSQPQDFDPGPNVFVVSPSELGESDVFVLKLSSEGNFVWVRSAGAGSWQCQMHGIAISPEGDVYSSGTFSSPMDFDPGPNTFILTPTGGDNAFIWKLDPGGNLIWARNVGGTSGDKYGRDVAVGSDGNVYVTGSFSGSADFDPGPGTYNLSSRGNYDAFVLKLNSTGDFVWARSMGGTGYDYSLGIAVAPDHSVYTTGSFEGTADFDPGPGAYNITSAGGADPFVSKLDAAGDFAWAVSLGVSSASCSGRDIAVLADGGVSATGVFAGTVDFDPGPDVATRTASGSSVFVWNLTATGGLTDAFSLGVSSSGAGIAVASDDSLYSTGSFSGTADFDPGPGTFTLASSSSDIFLWKLRANHAPAADAGGPYRIDEGDSLVLDASGSSDPDANAGDYVALYEWDLDNDGQFDDAATAEPVLDVTPEQMRALGLNDGDSLHVISLQVTDNSGLTAVDSTELTIHNLPPVIVDFRSNVSAIGHAVEGQAISVWGSFTDRGTFDTHTAVIDWGDQTASAATIQEADGAGSLAANHVYSEGGIYVITVSLTDDDLGKATAATTAAITGAGLRNGVVTVVGTAGNDHVVVTDIGRGRIRVQADFFPDGNPWRVFDVRAADLIHVRLGMGNDTAIIAGNVRTPTILDGGEGKDRLTGGRGNSILLGGAGDDILVGGCGRNVLIGGLGEDLLRGNDGDDILIGDATAYDDNDVALSAILAEWTSDNPYNKRVENIRNGTGLAVGYALDATMVIDDNAIDTLWGGRDRDWFLSSSKRDRVTDCNPWFDRMN